MAARRRAEGKAVARQGQVVAGRHGIDAYVAGALQRHACSGAVDLGKRQIAERLEHLCAGADEAALANPAEQIEEQRTGGAGHCQLLGTERRMTACTADVSVGAQGQPVVGTPLVAIGRDGEAVPTDIDVGTGSGRTDVRQRGGAIDLGEQAAAGGQRGTAGHGPLVVQVEHQPAELPVTVLRQAIGLANVQRAADGRTGEAQHARLARDALKAAEPSVAADIYRDPVIHTAGADLHPVGAAADIAGHRQVDRATQQALAKLAGRGQVAEHLQVQRVETGQALNAQVAMLDQVEVVGARGEVAGRLQVQPAGLGANGAACGLEHHVMPIDHHVRAIGAFDAATGLDADRVALDVVDVQVLLATEEHVALCGDAERACGGDVDVVTLDDAEAQRIVFVEVDVVLLGAGEGHALGSGQRTGAVAEVDRDVVGQQLADTVGDQGDVAPLDVHRLGRARAAAPAVEQRGGDGVAQLVFCPAGGGIELRRLLGGQLIGIGRIVGLPAELRIQGLVVRHATHLLGIDLRVGPAKALELVDLGAAQTCLVGVERIGLPGAIPGLAEVA